MTVQLLNGPFSSKSSQSISHVGRLFSFVLLLLLFLLFFISFRISANYEGCSDLAFSFQILILILIRYLTYTCSIK